jgi:molybdenum cofactor synthesis domain-containing protein
MTTIALKMWWVVPIGRTGNVLCVVVSAKVLTVSDSVAAGSRVDGSGDAVQGLLEANTYVVVERRVVPDGVLSVSAALRDLSSSFVGLIVTTGGTGFSQTDLTPEATRLVLEREAPGMAEVMRAASPLGSLSRGVAGTVGSSLILNVPGSVNGAIESLTAVMEGLSHALELLAGGRPH